MGDALNLALRLTAIDMLSGVLSRVKDRISSLGPEARKVKKDFDEMTSRLEKGLKGIAAASYGWSKMRPGVQAAADLQAAMINVRMNLMESTKSARQLDEELAQVRATAIEVSKVAPFSSQDVVEIQNTLLKAGLEMKDVVGKGGAAWAATALATITGEAPTAIAEALVSIASPFNMGGKDYGQLADLLQKVDTASVTSVPELMEGMKYVAGTAANLKVSLSDTLVSLGAMSQQGLRGSMAGTALNQFLLRLNAISPMSRKVIAAMGLHFHDAQGKLLPVHDIIVKLRERLASLTDQQKQVVMTKIFDVEGARAAFALMKEGKGSFEEVGDAMGRGVEIAKKMDVRLTGLGASLTALAGTAKSTLATLFDPMLKPLARVANLLNDIVAKVGQIGEKSPGLSAAVSFGATSAVVGAAGYGLWNLFKAGGAAGRVLKGMGGAGGILKSLGGTAAGIAEGKAVEAATGVTPVFVTNWPAGFGGPLTEAAKTGIGARLLSYGKSLPGLLRGSAAAAGLGTTALALAGAGGAGYGIGTLADYGITKALGGRSLGEKVYDWLHPEEMTTRAANVIQGGGRGEIRNTVPIVIHQYPDRVYAETPDMNTHVSVDLPRGRH